MEKGIMQTHCGYMDKFDVCQVVYSRRGLFQWLDGVFNSNGVFIIIQPIYTLNLQSEMKQNYASQRKRQNPKSPLLPNSILCLEVT